MELATSIRVLLVSPHPIMLTGLERLISSQKPKMQVVKELTQYSDAISQARKLLPDVILLDLDADIEEGINSIPLLSAASKAKILVLTGLVDDKVTDQAMLVGARGILRKAASGDGDKSNRGCSFRSILARSGRYVSACSRIISPEISREK